MHSNQGLPTLSPITKMLIKTTHAAYIFTLSILLYALGLYYYHDFSNYFLIIPGWHIQFNNTYLYIGCSILGILNILLYKKLSKRSSTIKVYKLILHILLTVPLWMLCQYLQISVLQNQFMDYVREGQLGNYYLKTFYKSMVLIVVIQIYYWYNLFKTTRSNAGSN